MPPRNPLAGPPVSSRPPGRFYAHIVASLMKVKTVLNLVISDLLRFILASFLFIAVLAIVVVILFYQQWLPKVTDFIKSAASSASVQTPQ